jgi:beta-glucosidase
VSPTAAGVQFADNNLAGFERIHLEPHQSQLVMIHLSLRQLQYWSTAQSQWVTPAGSRTVWVGSSSRDHKLASVFDLK